MINLYRKLCPTCNGKIILQLKPTDSAVLTLIYINDENLYEKFYFIDGKKFTLVVNTNYGIEYSTCGNRSININCVFGLTDNVFKELELIKLLI